MKKSILLIVGVLVAVMAVGQTMNIRKENGVWKYDLSGPISSYPISGGIITDTSAIPDPVPVITDDTTKIDAANASYIGSWTRTTNSTGWYRNTMAYSNVSGNTVTFPFQGTKIELYGEKKASHGTGVVTIRQGTTVVHSQSVSFVGATQLPALIYTSPNLALGNYTIELKVSSGYNLIDFYVVRDYAISTGGVEPLPVEPSGEIINVSPGQNIKQIIESASHKTINFTPGTYSLAYTYVPSTVNLQASPGTTPEMVRIIGTQGSSNDQGATLILRGNSTATGQFIKGITIDGNNISNGGIFVERNNVKLDVKVERHKFFGVWINACSNPTAKLTLIDNSWCSSSWASGEIVLGGHVRNGDLQLDWKTTSPSRGYGLKILWQNSATPNILENVKINLLGGELNHFSNWNNGQSRNIGVELYGCEVRGKVEITGIIKNQISLHPQARTDLIHIYEFVADTKDTYFIEAIASNTRVENGVIYNTAMMAANFQNNEVVSNVTFNNVRFVNPSGSAMSWGGVILAGHKGVRNFKVTNCEIDQLPGFPLVKYMGVTGGVEISSSLNSIY